MKISTLRFGNIEIEDEEIALSIIDSDGGEGAKEIIDLCRMLVDSQTTWKQYQSILSGINRPFEIPLLELNA